MPNLQKTNNETLLRLQDVIDRTGRRRSAIYADMAAGTFPLCVNIGPRAVAWVASEVDEWIAARIADRGAA